MDNALLIQDTLLYISIALISFGVGILSVNFWQGIISLVIAAGIIVARAILNKKYIEKKVTGIVKNDNKVCSEKKV